MDFFWIYAGIGMLVFLVLSGVALIIVASRKPKSSVALAEFSKRARAATVGMRRSGSSSACLGMPTASSMRNGSRPTARARSAYWPRNAARIVVTTGCPKRRKTCERWQQIVKWLLTLFFNYAF